MSAAAAATVPPKRGKRPLILGLVLAILGGGGGFAAVQWGLVGGESAPPAEGDHLAELPPIQPVAFIPLDPLIVNLAQGSGREFLRFSAQIEVAPAYQAEVEALRPRLLDVMNSYLRAVTAQDFNDPLVLERLRAQLLRRLQVIAGEGRVRDLLITEFVLN